MKLGGVVAALDELSGRSPGARVGGTISSATSTPTEVELAHTSTSRSPV